MNRIRLGAAHLALAAALSLLLAAPEARAAAEIHRLNLVISAIPTSIDGGDFNGNLDYFNRVELRSRGLESIDKASFGWLFTSELRYFVRPNVAVTAGVGQIKVDHKREFLPGLQQSVDLRVEVLSVPVNVGAAYYFTPYNSGDFQARAYLGGGVLSAVYNKAVFQSEAVITDTTLYANDPNTPLRNDTVISATGDAPGWYGEVGVHMFFAARYSVMIGAVYRSIKVRGMVDSDTRTPVTFLQSQRTPFTLDMSGVGMRGAIAIGF